MRIEAVSGYRVRAPHSQYSAQIQLNQVDHSQPLASSGRAGRVCNRYRRKLAKRRVWVPTRSPRAPAYDSIAFSSIDHSPFDLSMNSVDIEDTDPLIIKKNNAKRSRKQIREIRRWEKLRKQRKGNYKGCFRNARQD